MSGIDMEKAQRETMRWRILATLQAGRPMPVNEDLVLIVLQDANFYVTPHAVRRELDYLEDRQLIAIMGRGGPTWSAELTRVGVDLVEYTIDCEPGIARPRKWD
jgi:hypothetical protein